MELETTDTPVADVDISRDGASVPPESQTAYERRFKRPPDVPTEELEREMNEETDRRMDAT